MVRDMATAALLGMSAGGVMDAFVIAFRVPNLFRRLFGEGALAASYLPVLSAELESDRARAWQLVSVLMTWVAVILAIVVVLGELLCGLLWLNSDGTRVYLLMGLVAVMLPYLLFICLAAQISATLHALNRFGMPAFVPVLLNLVWIVGALWVAPWVAPHGKEPQAYVLAVCVLIGGVLQMTVQVPLLFKLGFRFDYNWGGARPAVKRIVITLMPMLFGLAVTQINTLMDSVIAWLFSAQQKGLPIEWLGGDWKYPMQQGAAAAVYYGERLYQLPVGILGVAVATVIFPLLSRHAARGEREKIGEDLALGLRLVLFLALPATAGLFLLAQPLARLLFERGEFQPEDTVRTADMIRYYGLGVWAYCALPVLIRGFYAQQDAKSPLRIGMWIVALNLILNAILIWPLAEVGLALSTAAAAGLQAIWLTVTFTRQTGRLDWRAIVVTCCRGAAASIAMSGAGLLTLRLLPAGDQLTMQFITVVLPVAVCVVVYLLAYSILGGSEWRILTSGQ